MKPTQVRLKDIARDLGVSVVTVSKVLRNHSDIGPETRERVLRRIRELNYRPNLAARALITGRSYTMGLVVPDLLHSFFAQVAKALSAAIRQKGYSLIIASSQEDPELEVQEIDHLLTHRVDAILIASAHSNPEVLRKIEERDTPYILIDRQFAGLAADFVGVDDVAVGALAARHLIDQGCRHIAHIRGPEVSTAAGRFEGYRCALAAAGLEIPPGYVVSIGTSGDDRGIPGGHAAMQKLLAASPRPDGVFCYNDPVAVGAMRAVLESRLRIPEDIAIIGCGNLPYSDLFRVPLSTIDQDSVTIGTEAAKRALAVVESKEPQPPASILAHPRLIARASTHRSG